MRTGAIVLAAGAKGKRYALPHSKIMIHQPWGAIGGQAADVQIQAEEILYIKKRMNEVIAHHTGQSVEQVEKDTDRDNFMSPQQAKAYGIIDTVLGEKAEGDPAHDPTESGEAKG